MEGTDYCFYCRTPLTLHYGYWRTAPKEQDPSRMEHYKLCVACAKQEANWREQLDKEITQ